MSFYAYLGHIVRLENENKLDSIKEISGASAGALVSFGFLIGRNQIEKLVQEALDIDLIKLMKIDILNFINNHGIFKMAPLRQRISEFCFTFTGKHDMTFKELYELSGGIKLHIPAFSMDKKECEYFSVDVVPDKSVIDAICMSIAIPLVIEPYMNHMDGALTEMVPFTPFLKYTKEDIYIIRMCNTRVTKYTGVISFINYVFDIFWHCRHDVDHDWPACRIPVPPDSTFNYKMSRTEKEKLYLLGATAR